MAVFSLEQVSILYERSLTTTWRHITKLEKKKLFKKTAMGRGYNDKDVRSLSELLHFSLDLDKLKPKRK